MLVKPRAFSVFIRGIALLGVMAWGLIASASERPVASSASEMLSELNARNVVRKQVFSRAERFLERDSGSCESRVQTVADGLSALGFSESDVRNAVKNERFFLGKTPCPSHVSGRGMPAADNSYLISALKSLDDAGEDKNVHTALDFATGGFAQVAPKDALLAAALANEEKNAFHADVLSGWATFESRAMNVLLAAGASGDAPAVPPTGPVDGWMTAFSPPSGARVSISHKAGQGLTATVVTPENKRFLELQPVSLVPLAGYYLIAQTNILRE